MLPFLSVAFTAAVFGSVYIIAPLKAETFLEYESGSSPPGYIAKIAGSLEKAKYWISKRAG